MSGIDGLLVSCFTVTFAIAGCGCDKGPIETGEDARIKSDLHKPKLRVNPTAKKKKLAAEHLARAKILLDGGNASDAVGEFQNAVKLDPVLATETKPLLDLARKLAASTGGGGVLSGLNTGADGGIQPETARMEYEKAMQRSIELLANADSEAEFSAATESAKVARKAIEGSKSLFGDDEYNRMQAAVAQRIQWIAVKRIKWGKAKHAKERM